MIIGGDIVPTKQNEKYFGSGDTEALLGKELTDVLRKADYRIFNLEVPLTDRETPNAKFGPNLIAPTTAAKGLKAMGADLLTLANNHIMDQGKEGLASTLSALKEQEIAYVGVGSHSEEAAEPYFFELEGKKFGVYACAEHEFSIVTATEPGANPIDPLETPDQIKASKEKCDYLIILYHGGKEHFRYPSPGLQKTCRKLIDKGADLVVCQHSHCIGCEEKYKKGTIVYGQGNFLFIKDTSEYWKTSLLLEIDEKGDVRYIPLVQTRNGVRLADENEREEVLSAFRKRGEEIRQPGFVEKNYHEYAHRQLGYYLLEFSGREVIIFAFRVLDKLCGHKLRDKLTLRKSYTRRHHLLVRNFVECEAHSELIREALSGRD